MRTTIARWVTRGLLVVFLLVSFDFTTTGCAQSSDVRDRFTVRFTHQNADCSDDETVFLYLDTATGQPMGCRLVGFALGGGDDGPKYFDYQQSEQVLALAARLGKDGLSDADQRQIQGLVDSIAARLPQARVPYQYTGLWGRGLSLAGLVIAVLAIGLYASPWRRGLEAKIGGR
jgi:hypothetical protein